MKLPFINRTSELAAIRKTLSSSEPQLLILYGRRRCGKSRLLQEVANRQTIYYLADQSDQALQRQALAQQLSRVLPGFGSGTYHTWTALFEALSAQSRHLHRRKPIALILDEFPYLITESAELPSVIQKTIDSNTLGVHLILSGSSQRMMKGLVLDDTAPLYGRARQIIKIRPIKPGWIPHVQKMSTLDVIEWYAIWGGIPRYWELATEYPDSATAVRELVFNRDGILHNEPRRLLLDDMRSDTQPHSVLSVIGLGVHRISEISARLEKPAMNLIKPIETLMELGLVRREIPFGESEKNSKKSFYTIADPFLRFWYRFVCPRLSDCEQEHYAQAVAHWNLTKNQFIGEAWEDLSRDSVPRLSIANRQWKPSSRWWGKDTHGVMHEIDIVAESIDGKSILLGEAKWGTHNPTSLHEELMTLSSLLPFAKNKNIVTACWIGHPGIAKNGLHVFGPDEVLAVLQ